MKPIIYAKLIDFISFMGKAMLFVWGGALIFGEFEISDSRSIVLLSVAIISLIVSFLLELIAKK